MEIEIYSDIVCPWCYVGKARLDAAVATFDGEVTLRWRAFQLDPNPPGNPGLRDWLEHRLGGAHQTGPDAGRADTGQARGERVRDYLVHLTAAAAETRLPINFERPTGVRTFDAHRVLWFADQPQAVFFGATASTQPDLADALHRAHFRDGLDVSQHPVLISVAESVGLAASRVDRLLRTTEGIAEVRGQLARAHSLGVARVPTFIFAGRYAVTGAHPTPALRAVLDEVVRREGMAPARRQLVPTQNGTPRHGDSRVS